MSFKSFAIHFLMLLALCIFDFTAKAQFVVRGDAVQLSDKCYRITQDQINLHGSVWSEQLIDLTKPVQLEFIIYLGNKDATGADGIAFLFHNDPRGFAATGNVGRGLGFGYGSGDLVGYNPNNFISPSVAIEFDTWYNEGDASKDIPADHTAIVYNGNVDHPVAGPVQLDPTNPDVENNRCHTYKIKWDPATQLLELYFDDQLRIKRQDDIINSVFGGKTQVYYGFTGSTGGFANEQTICILGESSEPVAQDDKATAAPGEPVTVDVLSNDTHTGGASIALTRIVHTLGNGSVAIVDGKIVYTPDAWFTGTEIITYEISDVGASSQCYAKTTRAQLKVNVACPASFNPVVISADGAQSFCAGSKLVLSYPGPTGPTYQWKRNGTLVGSNNPAFTVTESGTYTLSKTSVCGTTTSNAINITVHELPAAPVSPDVARCGEGTVTLTVSGGINGEYRWYTAASDIEPIAGAVQNTFTTPHLTSSTTYYVAIERNNCSSGRVPVKAIVNNIPLLIPYTEVIVDEGTSTVLEATGGGTYAWSPARGLSHPAAASTTAQPAETTLYTVVVTTPEGCQVTAQFKVVIRKKLVIPNAFSPNGDGVNDTWEIATLEGYPDSQIEIFDRWGSRLYEKTGYLNEWDGTRLGKALPVSTYYYVLTLKSGQRFKGIVSIIR